MVQERPLRFYESICSIMNINLMLEIESPNLNLTNTKQAFILLQKRHPYFRLKIRKNSDEVICFVQENHLESKNEFINKYDLNDSNELQDWSERLIKFGSKNRDHSKSLIYIEIYSFKHTHQIYFCINHAGIDGPGAFTAVKDFLFYLDSFLNGDCNQIVESRQFLDIHQKYEHTYDLESLKLEKIILDNYLESVKALNDPPKEFAYLSAKFFQLTEDQTKNLIENCKSNKSTIQGALSTALMIALIKDKKVSFSEENLKVFNCCPCNMRNFFGFNSDDIVCGSAALTWCQDVKLKSSLWELASEASFKIKEQVKSNNGFKWWIKLSNSIPLQPYSIMSSSMGIVDLNQERIKNLIVKDLRFLGSAYESHPASVGCMTHAFTCLNKFTYNFSYTFPNLTHQWADNFSQNILKIILLMIDNQNLTLINTLDLLTAFNSEEFKE